MRKRDRQMVPGGVAPGLVCKGRTRRPGALLGALARAAGSAVSQEPFDGLSNLIELVRAPAALSVPGDAVAGATAAGCLDKRTAGIAAASVCLYWAGMAANDWADRELDAVERPERPIPSGRISPAQALTVASGLTVAGLALAALSGNRRTLATAGALAGAVWAYDLRLKNTPAGPAGMALCRGLDVLLGASTGRMHKAVRPAAIIAAHTYVLTELSRREVTGTSRALPLATMAATAAIAASQTRGRTATILAGWYASMFGRAQQKVFLSPKGENVRAAVGAGIMSLPALQGAIIARQGKPVIGAAIAVAAPLGRRLVRS